MGPDGRARISRASAFGRGRAGGSAETEADVGGLLDPAQVCGAGKQGGRMRQHLSRKQLWRLHALPLVLVAIGVGALASRAAAAKPTIIEKNNVLTRHFAATDECTSNDLTGKSIPVNGVRHIVFDFVNGTFTETGVLRHVTVPGQGIVLHESGRIVSGLESEELIFEAGPHQLFHGDLAGFCSVLAAP